MIAFFRRFAFDICLRHHLFSFLFRQRFLLALMLSSLFFSALLSPAFRHDFRAMPPVDYFA